LSAASSIPSPLAVNASLNVKTVDELVALSKARPATLSYTAPSPPLMLYLESLKREHGAHWVGIPFRGGRSRARVHSQHARGVRALPGGKSRDRRRVVKDVGLQPQ
jgi:tripartite-type tricarboxylate transporter receptor subunit TctC